MLHSSQQDKRHVIIVSANPLFREGLRKLSLDRWGKGAVVIDTPGSMDETIISLGKFKPDLVIVDYDDKNINRGDFLSSFMQGESTMKVVLVSLSEAGRVIVYDRLNLSSSQAEDWLNNLWTESLRQR